MQCVLFNGNKVKNKLCIKDFYIKGTILIMIIAYLSYDTRDMMFALQLSDSNTFSSLMYSVLLLLMEL